MLYPTPYLLPPLYHTYASLPSPLLLRTRTDTLSFPRYKQIPISFLQNELCLETPEGTHQFLQEYGCAIYTPDAKSVDCNAIDQVTLQKTFEQKYRKINIKGAI